MEQFKYFLDTFGIPHEKNVDLRKRTWIHRGGIAEFFVVPANIEQLIVVIDHLYKRNIAFLLIGCTSNLYIRNSTNIQVVVSTIKCNQYELKDGVIVCDCGVLVSRLAKSMIERGIKGFEYLTKLPGTIAAAVYNNSSVKSQDNSITNLLKDLELLTPSGLLTLSANELHLDFRTSDLKKHLLTGVILRCRLRAENGDKERMLLQARENEEERNKILEGPVNNLGCTVHKMFCNGPMPKRYYLPYRLYSKAASLVLDADKLKRTQKNFLLTISGYRKLIPYVSAKQMITFIWRDDRADILFDDYLKFMREVCKTDRIEIEII